LPSCCLLVQTLVDSAWPLVCNVPLFSQLLRRRIYLRNRLSIRKLTVGLLLPVLVLLGLGGALVLGGQGRGGSFLPYRVLGGGGLLQGHSMEIGRVRQALHLVLKRRQVLVRVSYLLTALLGQLVLLSFLLDLVDI